MFATLSQYLNGVPNPQIQQSLVPVVKALGDRLSSQTLTSGALAINAALSPTVKVGAAYYGIANGVLVTKAAATTMTALSGSVTNARFNVYCFFIDSAGVLTTVIGSEGVSLAAVKFPNTPAGKACIGFVIVNPTGTGAFVGGTTNLDDATVIPNAVYVNTQGAFDPSVLLGS